MVRAGGLRRRVTIQQRSDAQDTFGEADPTWTTLATVWASIEPMQGSEMMGGGLEMDSTPYVFRVRYSTTITALNPKTHRISWNSQTFDITSVNNADQRNREMQIATVLRG